MHRNWIVSFYWWEPFAFQRPLRSVAQGQEGTSVQECPENYRLCGETEEQPSNFYLAVDFSLLLLLNLFVQPSGWWLLLQWAEGRLRSDQRQEELGDHHGSANSSSLSFSYILVTIHQSYQWQNTWIPSKVYLLLGMMTFWKIMARISHGYDPCHKLSNIPTDLSDFGLNLR